MSLNMQNLDDKTLLEKLRENKLEAFEEFFKRNQPYMVSYAFKLLDDWETARDIVQEVFISFWENKNKIIITTSLKAYLFSAIKNQCANNVKHQQVKQKFTSQVQAELHQMELAYLEAEEPYLKLHEKELDKKIEQTINSLPEQCRLTFELSRYKGMKSKDIAKKMDISVRTVETQIYRALKVLRSSLKDYLTIF